MKQIPTEIRSHRLAARSIRQELEKAFPKVKFSVRTNTTNLGEGCIFVTWSGGATREAVNSIINKYQHKLTFYPDDYVDAKETNFHKEFGGARFVHAQQQDHL